MAKLEITVGEEMDFGTVPDGGLTLRFVSDILQRDGGSRDVLGQILLGLAVEDPHEKSMLKPECRSDDRR